MALCAVPTCKEKRSLKSRVAFHKIPNQENEELREKWFEAIGDWKFVTPANRRETILVCGKHFKPTDYALNRTWYPRRSMKHCKLRVDAVPTLHLPPPLSHQLREASLRTKQQHKPSSSAPARSTERPSEAADSGPSLVQSRSHLVPVKDISAASNSPDSDFMDAAPSTPFGTWSSQSFNGTKKSTTRRLLKTKPVTTVDPSAVPTEFTVLLESPMSSPSESESESDIMVSGRATSFQTGANRPASKKLLKIESTTRSDSPSASKPASVLLQSFARLESKIASTAPTEETVTVSHGSSAACPSSNMVVPDENMTPSEPQSHMSCHQTSRLESQPGSSQIAPVANSKKILIFEDALFKLLQKCTICGKPNEIVKCKPPRGSHMSLNILCESGHTLKWNSSPEADRLSLMNLLCVCATFCSGGTYTDNADFFDLMKMEFIGCSQFYDILKAYVVPTVKQYFNDKSRALLAEMKTKKNITLIGDGQCDSPGFSATYMLYSFMEEETEKVIHVQLVQSTESKNSEGMEKIGFERGLDLLLSEGLDIKTVVTDRARSIEELMRTKYSSIDHQYDIWHVCKGNALHLGLSTVSIAFCECPFSGLKMELLEVADHEGNEVLHGWIKSITNHLWWACEHCGGDAGVLKQKWLSILSHITDTHEWVEDGVRYCCDHDILTEDHRERMMWIQRDSSCFKELQRLVDNRKLLKDLEQMTLFKHTGSLEVYHDIIQKFAPKRLQFCYDSILARFQLSALDHNENIGRMQAIALKGISSFREVNSKQAKEWITRKFYEGKTKNYAHELMQKVVVNCTDPNFTDTVAWSSFSRSVAPVPAPPFGCFIAKRRQAKG